MWDSSRPVAADASSAAINRVGMAVLQPMRASGTCAAPAFRRSSHLPELQPPVAQQPKVDHMNGPAVYDSQARINWPGPDGFADAYRNWLLAHGVNPNTTYRVEHHVIDCPLIRIFQLDRDEVGRVRVDPATRDFAVRAPFDLLVTSDPPRPEDYT